MTTSADWYYHFPTRAAKIFQSSGLRAGGASRRVPLVEGVKALVADDGHFRAPYLGIPREIPVWRNSTDPPEMLRLR